jgi:hypothetical protein
MCKEDKDRGAGVRWKNKKAFVVQASRGLQIVVAVI